MYSLLLFTVIVTVLLQPVAASSPFLDLIMSDTPMDGSYPDIHDVLCELCCLPFYECIHARMSQVQHVASSSFYDDSRRFHMPSLDFDQTQSDFALLYQYVNPGVQPLISEHVRVMDANETTIQPATVQAHVEDTYTPGDRLSARRERRAQQKRQAPRAGGFHCNEDGCGKTFDRQCDLNRHQKKHSRELPHKCLTCNRRFLYPKDLRRHLPQHNDPSLVTNKHLCKHPGCDNLEGFSRRDNLLRHQRRQHPKK